MSTNMLSPAQTQKLRQALASGSRLGASDLRIINTDVYRERLGREWPKYRDIISAYAAVAIEMELGKDDFFVETKNGYGIFFFKKDLNEVRQISGRIETRLRRQLSGDTTFGDPPLGCKSVSVDCQEFLQQLETEARTARPAALIPAALKASLPPDTMQAQSASGKYAPFWHSKLERIVGSIYVPNIVDPLLRAPDREYYAPSSLRMRDDISYFNAMLSDAYKLHKSGESTAILFSLNFMTFCEPAFVNEYMQVLRQTPASLLKHLTPRFVRIPPHTSQALIASRVQALTTIFKHVVLQMRPPVDLRCLEFVPCSILAMSWKDAIHTAGQDARALEKTARTFCQTARTVRANVLIADLDSTAAFEIAATAGAEFMSGAAISSPEVVPLTQRVLSFAGIRAAHRGHPI